MTQAVVKRALEVDKILAAHYGTKVFHKGRDPLTELIKTILSQNTSDRNRDIAFAALQQHYPTWDKVVSARPSKLASVIRPAGLGRIRAARIIKVLQAIRQRAGGYSLDFLKRWPDDRVRSYLTSLEGVGPKTAACVMAFALGRNVMPVDVHVYRVARRLGLLPSSVSVETAHDYFLGLAQRLSLYQFHLNLIAHGRKICRPRKPLCDVCVVNYLCLYHAATGHGEKVMTLALAGKNAS